MFQVLDPQKISFPPVEAAGEDGLLAIGGDLSQERLLLAYQSGIFPWYGELDPICWWSPDPRFVLFPNELKISKSMRAVLNQNRFQFKINSDFKSVIRNCKKVTRQGQEGTWISDAMEKAYTDLHIQGHAQCAETWLDTQLAGGLYGIKMKNVFCGESMFSLVNNASKFAFINYVQQLASEGVQVIDCQVHTEHLESLGARFIEREEFLRYL